MAKKARTYTFQDAMAAVRAVVALAKSFQGFLIPQGIKDDLTSAMTAMTERGDAEAVRILMMVEKGLQSLLSVFFRNSPKFFERKLVDLEEMGLEKDLMGGLTKQLDLIRSMGKVSDQVNLEEAQRFYSKMFEFMEQAVNEMDRRVVKRREDEEKRELLQAERQRELEKARRQGKATEIGSLLETLETV